MDRSNLAFGHLTDKQMAYIVAMLMRNDLNHEAVLAGARDRIRYLSDEVESLRARLKEKDEALQELQNKLVEAENSLGYLMLGLENATLFADWIEFLGRTDCEIYKHELKSRADLCLKRISDAIQQAKRGEG